MMMKRTLLLSSLALLLACGTSAAAAPADYESKMQAALENYVAHSDEILQRAIKVGNDGAAFDSVEIDANGDVTSSSSAALYAEFGSAAVNTALDKINKEIEQQDLLEEYEETFEELTEQNGEGATTITYGQLEQWEDVVPIIDKLEDGEFLLLWRKATGSDSEVMAKVDFKALTKRMFKKEIPYNRLYNWPALSEDLSDKDFHKLWKKALGEDVLKGVMNYEQFL
eukprot:scaffold26434_cov66-Skeletonema_marinoi.AAC.1